MCFVLFLVIYLFFKKDLCSPIILFSSCFLISSFIFMLNTNIWNYEIAYKTMIIIVFSILFFSLGCIIGNKMKVNVKNSKPINKESQIIIMNKKMYYAFFAITIIAICVRMLSVLYTVGNLDIFNGSIGMYRHYDGSVKYDFYLKLLSPCMSAIVIYSIIVLLSCFKNKMEGYFKYLLLILGYFIYNMLSSSRIDIIYLFIYISGIYIFTRKKTFKKSKNIWSYCLLILGVYVFIRIFFSLGYLTGKSQIQTSVFDNISIYSASSIGALDVYLKQFSYSIQNLFTYSMKGLFNFLSYFNINLSTIDTDQFGFIMYGNMTHTTNIYTSLSVLIHDFGYIGSMIVLFFEGLFFQYIYIKTKKYYEAGNFSWLMTYVYIMPLIMLSSITDRVFSSLLTITTIIFLMFIKLTKRSINTIKIRNK